MCRSEDESSKRRCNPSEAPSGASIEPSGSVYELASEAPSAHSSGHSPDDSSGPRSGSPSDQAPGRGDRPPSRPSTLPNAFSSEFLERLRTEHDHPPTPEAANAGPFRVEPVEWIEWVEFCPPSSPGASSPPAGAPNAGAPPAAFRWACVGEGEEAPRALLAEPDLAYLTAAALPLTGRAPRFELVEDLDAEEEDLSLLVSGCGAPPARSDRDWGTVRGRNEDLPRVLTVLDELRLRPLALAHFLLSVGDETLARTGRILSKLAAGPAPSPASPASQASQTAQTSPTSEQEPER